MSSECYENRTKENSELEDTEQQVFVRSQSVVSRLVAGETLIVPIRGRVGDLASIYSFNGTGSMIWQMLESPRTISDLIEAVAQQFDVERARAEQDVKRFVREMIAVCLVEVSTFVAAGTEGPVGREGLEAAGAS